MYSVAAIGEQRQRLRRPTGVEQIVGIGDERRNVIAIGGGVGETPTVGETLPESAADAETATRFLREIDALLRRDHHEDYCGIVYADDLDNPTLVKIYDPNNLGSSCGGTGKHAIPPGWVMSRVPPREIIHSGVVAANRKRWWQAFLDGSA